MKDYTSLFKDINCSKCGSKFSIKRTTYQHCANSFIASCQGCELALSFNHLWDLKEYADRFGENNKCTIASTESTDKDFYTVRVTNLDDWIKNYDLVRLIFKHPSTDSEYSVKLISNDKSSGSND